ncbi:condensin complex subunit 1-like isoform X3 [Dinothrombium tinctorium]|uniref:Condensin complex subunit 1 n=1 Tax=Dinothrombium tinctorium TaxID=1965070 RepID=A0A3S3NX17_9ACAR|nr:condensin complex subunit 1-like isoform X3 [Dinothrombium tinctorium]
MSFKFIPPLKLADLKAARNESSVYVVSNEYSSKEVALELKGTKLNVQEKSVSIGPEFILEDFDLFYSVLVNFSSLEQNVKSEAWRIIYKSICTFAENISDNLNDSRTLNETHDRNRTCNVLKMNLFVYCYMLELFEDQDSKNTSDIEAQNKERGIKMLLELFSMSIHRLFAPPVIEEELINCITKCCWKILENPKNKPLYTNLFHILGLAVEKHGQSLSFCLKIIQILQHKEQMVPTLAQLVETIIKNYNQRLILSELFIEVGRIDTRELSRDSSGARAVSSFLVEIVERCPAEALPSVSHVLGFLDEDAYLMRNASLSIIGGLVSKVLSEDEMDAKSKNLRDTLLDKLEAHIHDVNAFTRGRALQVWCRLSDECKIPLTRWESLVPMAAGRLKDKACYVRKSAIQFMTSFLKKNEFVATIPTQSLKEAYEKEKGKLKTLMGMIGKENDEEMMETKEDSLEQWNKIQPEMIKFWEELDSSSASGDDSSDKNVTNVSDCNDIKDALERFCDLIVNKNESTMLPPTLKLCKRLFLKARNQKASFDLNNREVRKNVEAAASIIISNSQSTSATTKVSLARLSCSESSMVDEVNKQQLLVKYLHDCFKFAEEIKKIFPIMCELLQSRNVSDVQEVINFFVSAYELNVPDSLIGIRKMLCLVFSQEAAIREAVVKAYKNVYLESIQLSEMTVRNRAITIVKNLTELISGANIGELISLEELLKQFMASGDLDNNCIQVMWERFAMKIPNTTLEESRIAVLLIAMISNSNSEIIRKNFDTLIDIGLSERANNDLQMVNNTCIALRKAVDNQGKLDLRSLPYRFPATHRLFSRLSENLISTLFALEADNWVSACDEALKVIFLLAENPDKLCEDILKCMIKEIMTNCKIDITDINSNASSGIQSGLFQSSQESNSETIGNSHAKDDVINAEVLARFITFIGSVALNILIHLEVNILTELKIRNALKEEKDKRKSNGLKTPRIRRSLPSTPRTPNAGNDQLEEEMGLAGAGSAEDFESEFISRLCNEEIVEYDLSTGNLLARLSSVIITVASDPIRYPDPHLRAAATLSLAKYMAVSEKFCSRHLQLFFTILEKSPEPLIRANAMIAIGDLCIRYPNILDPWTSQLYSPLRDRDVTVRTNALKVISRLILSDMVKVKGQISEMAVLMVDDNPNLSSMAKLFFTELGKKQNAIYNVLPDIISHLSDTEIGIEENNFRSIMKYLFDLIEKDRQTLCLVEKLCQRFRMTINERQWRDLAFCLSLLNYSERSITKLYENMICFADKLSIDAVYDCFVAIINASRKMPNIKNETKQILDEFEQKVNECRSKGVNEDESEIRQVIGIKPNSSAMKRHSKPPSAQKSALKTAPRSTKSKPIKTARKIFDFAEDDEEDDDFVPQAKVINKGNERERAQRERKKRIAQLFDDSDEED